MESLFTTTNLACADLEEKLRIIKDSLEPRGKAEEFWITIKPLLPASGELQPLVQVFERQTNTPLEWEKLEEWLSRARRCTEQHQTVIRKCVSILGFDLPPLSDLDGESADKMITETFEKHPIFQRLRNIYGPEWSSYQEGLIRLNGINILESEKLIPMKDVQPTIEASAVEILRQWRNLQEMKEQGVMGRFRQRWAQLSLPERSIWLQRHCPMLHTCPHPDIYQWVQHPELGLKRLERRAFLMPLLNVVDLSQGDILPDLLDIRADLHPKLFLPMDSSSVPFGFWCRALVPMQIEGRLSFSHEVSHENTEYGIHFEDRSMTNPYLVNPCVGLYQLRAQKLAYDFLVGCPTAMLDSCESRDTESLSSNDGLGGELTSILTQSVQLSFVKPNCIDWERLQSLLKASLDEALDDLWQLRTDADFWFMRMQETGNSGSGRTSNLLRNTFGRIDVFHALCTRLDALQNKNWCGTRGDELTMSPPSVKIDSLKDVISMYVTFHCVLNEALSSIRAISWSPDEASTTTFSRLVNMMNKNDPTLRVMGLDAVLRVVEREIKEFEIREVIPFALMQALNDMSVVAVCAREAQKHYTFVPSDSLEYVTLANESEAEWANREHSWSLVIDHALRKLVHKRHNLDACASDKGLVLERHTAFWKTIDESWTHEMKTNSVVSLMRRSAPIKVPLSLVENTSMTGWTMPDSRGTAFNPKIALSRRRRSNTSMSSARSIALPLAKEPQPPRPTVNITRERDKDFWRKMWDKMDGSLYFLDLCEFMRGGGYTMQYQGGSGRRFELRGPDGSFLDTIVFHQHHGHHEQKVAHFLARKWWGRRIQNHVNVELK